MLETLLPWTLWSCVWARKNQILLWSRGVLCTELAFPCFFPGHLLQIQLAKPETTAVTHEPTDALKPYCSTGLTLEPLSLEALQLRNLRHTPLLTVVVASRIGRWPIICATPPANGRGKNEGREGGEQDSSTRLSHATGFLASTAGGLWA